MNDIKSEIKSSASSMKWMGILTIICGILAMMMPYITGQSVLMLIGILVMAGGILRMVWAFKAGSLGKLRKKKVMKIENKTTELKSPGKNSCGKN